MSVLGAQSNSWKARLAAVADRLVNPAIVEPAMRHTHARLIAVLLAAPFLLAIGIVLFMAAILGALPTLAAICAVFGIFWLAALIVVASGRLAIAATVGAVTFTACTAPLIVATGGLSSPTALLALAGAAEAWWIFRSRTAVRFGVAATVGVLLLAVIDAAYLDPGIISPASWLLPAAYALSLALRLGARQHVPGAGEKTSLESLLLSSSVCFEIERAGEVAEVTGAVEMFGLPSNLLLASGLLDRVHIGDKAPFLCAVADARDGKLVAPIELRVRVPVESGAPDRFDAFTAEFFSDNGRVVAVFRSAAALGRLRSQLEQAERASGEIETTKSRFLASVSHELRTPLNSIIGFSDMMLQEIACRMSDPKQREYVGLIRNAGSHLLDVVNSILDVSKLESGAYPIDIEPFTFADAVTMSHSLMTLQAESKGVTISEQIAPNLAELHADRRAVQQILINLLSNAVKFTPAGGMVVIGARRLGTRLHFHVSDTGIGIAEEDLERIGEPFVQVQNDYTRQYEGSGLGLSVVKGLVALHDGTMSVESAPGQGTTVSISLPLFGPKKRESGRDGILKAPFGARNGETNAPIRKAG